MVRMVKGWLALVVAAMFQLNVAGEKAHRPAQSSPERQLKRCEEDVAIQMPDEGPERPLPTLSPPPPPITIPRVLRAPNQPSRRRRLYGRPVLLSSLVLQARSPLA